MNMALLLALISLLLLFAGLRVLHQGMRQSGSEAIALRLSEGQVVSGKKRLGRFERRLLRAGLSLSGGSSGFLLLIWLLALGLTYLLGGLLAALLGIVLSIAAVQLFVSWRYRRRVQRMIMQMPQFLDHIIRSLKSGRTLGDAMILAMSASQSPLHDAFIRTRRSIELGMPLADAMDDFANLYEREEFHILALGIRVNQQYGGNASELLNSLIILIRDRDRAARQLRALTGETRISAMVLAGLPVALAGYILFTNPQFLLGLWHDSTGRMLLLCAFMLQALGSFFMWRMLRSI